MIGPDSPARHPRRIPELDGLRAVAILAVFVHHALNVPLLWMGVDLFFVLSGFLITGILLDRKESGRSFFSYFYERRARRILVPYIVLLAGSSLFLAPRGCGIGTGMRSLERISPAPSIRPGTIVWARCGHLQ